MGVAACGSYSMYKLQHVGVWHGVGAAGGSCVWGFAASEISDTILSCCFIPNFSFYTTPSFCYVVVGPQYRYQNALLLFFCSCMGSEIGKRRNCCNKVINLT